MSNSDLTYSDRTTSAFPLSIGTSLAFESMFISNQASYDPLREIPQKINYSDYDILFINLKTLLRNIMGAISLDEQKTPVPVKLYNTLVSEIDVITNMLVTYTNGLLKPLFYFTGYSELKELERKKIVTLRTNKTDKQKLWTHLEDKILDNVFKLRNSYKIEKTTIHDIKVRNTRVLIMTHMPFDLISYRNFKKFDLLESHTGKLKEFNQFNSKYYPLPETNMSNLPFSFTLLALLGDKNLFKPYPIKIRQGLMDVAIKKKWTPLTNNIKIKGDLIGANLDSYLPMMINSLPKI